MRSYKELPTPKSFGLPLRKEKARHLLQQLFSTRDLEDSYYMLLHLGTRKFRDYLVTWICQVPNIEAFLTRELRGAPFEP
ncbi:unnamed protein product [Malus baccata var. baccata]